MMCGETVLLEMVARDSPGPAAIAEKQNADRISMSTSDGAFPFGHDG
jgi:hypothetical protein